ncbi:MAG: GTP 3',8-cyclase MoaA [Rhodocyclaceae bacterium]
MYMAFSPEGTANASTARSHTLIDTFGRRIEYLRLSVTDRCDLRCTYCMPKGFKGFEQPADWLTFDEIERVVRMFAQHGVSRLRITGGEPLLRRDLPELLGRLSLLPGIDDLSLSTNATRLAPFAAPLRAAGVRRLNVSLDALDRHRVLQISGRDCLPAVLKGLDAAQDAGFAPIRINMVVMAGVNDDQIDPMVNFCFGRGFELRLIETMPMGDTGRAAAYKSLEGERRRLVELHDLAPQSAPAGGGPARYWQTPDGRHRIGFITPISEHFCGHCNRLRLTVNGTLHACLGDEGGIDLRSVLREHPSDAELLAAIHRAVATKPERHEFVARPDKLVRFMSRTGG